MIPTSVSAKDREYLRTLAARVREIAELPEMAVRRARLVAHNGLRGGSPIVLCFPEGAWDEILPPGALQCESELLRQWEWALRSKIHWWEDFRDDNAIDPFFDLRWNIASSDYGVAIPQEHGENRGSAHWTAPFESIADCLKKLRPATHTIDRAQNAAEMELADRLFGDLLPPRRGTRQWWSSGQTQHIFKYIGLETLLLAPYDQPEDFHRIMQWFNDEHIRYLEWMESEGLLTPANFDAYAGSGGVGYTDELPQADHVLGSPTRLIDSWGFAEAQETVGMSPEMFAEFIFPYHLAVLEKFGLNCYGCCERVHERIDTVLTLPRLRRVSVSPWADQKIMAEKLAGRAIFSRKPNPAQICVGFDESKIREDLRATLELAGRGALEIIMKDTHTVQNEPWRLTRWIQIAQEEVRVYMERR